MGKTITIDFIDFLIGGTILLLLMDIAELFVVLHIAKTKKRRVFFSQILRVFSNILVLVLGDIVFYLIFYLKLVPLTMGFYYMTVLSTVFYYSYVQFQKVDEQLKNPYK